MKPRNFVEDMRRRSDADLRRILKAVPGDPWLSGVAKARAVEVLLRVIRERARAN